MIKRTTIPFSPNPRNQRNTPGILCDPVISIEGGVRQDELALCVSVSPYALRRGPAPRMEAGRSFLKV